MPSRAIAPTADPVGPWRPLDEDYPGWRDQGEAELRDWAGVAWRGRLEVVGIRGAGREERPIWKLTLADGTVEPLDETFVAWRKVWGRKADPR